MIGVFTVVSTIIQQNASYEQRQQDKVDARLLRQQSDQHAGNLQRETALANYLTDISRLFISDNQTTILTHVRTKTLTTLRQLDAERKKHLFLFLYENELLHRSVRALQWAGADFNGIAFRATADTRCSFLRVQLVDVYLSEASFDGCYLDYSNLSDSTMLRTAFLHSLLMRSSFQSTLLDKSRFIGSKLVNISFFGASLIESNFTGSVWEKESVDLTNSNLREAILSDEQLRNSTLLNCLLPNGTWSRMQTTNLLVNADLDKNVSRRDQVRHSFVPS